MVHMVVSLSGHDPCIDPFRMGRRRITKVQLAEEAVCPKYLWVSLRGKLSVSSSNNSVFFLPFLAVGRMSFVEDSLGGENAQRAPNSFTWFHPNQSAHECPIPFETKEAGWGGRQTFVIRELFTGRLGVRTWIRRSFPLTGKDSSSTKQNQPQQNQNTKTTRRLFLFLFFWGVGFGCFWLVGVNKQTVYLHRQEGSVAKEPTNSHVEEEVEGPSRELLKSIWRPKNGVKPPQKLGLVKGRPKTCDFEFFLTHCAVFSSMDVLRTVSVGQKPKTFQSFSWEGSVEGGSWGGSNQAGLYVPFVNRSADLASYQEGKQQGAARLLFQFPQVLNLILSGGDAFISNIISFSISHLFPLGKALKAEPKRPSSRLLSS